MIRLQDSTPSVYYMQSRDFQFIGRLYDIVLNSIKTNADNLYNLPIGKNMDERLLNLLSYTLGFKTKKLYNATQLAAVCSVLPKILREKGSINSIETAVHAMLSAEGIKQPLDYTVIDKDCIILYLPERLGDLSLLRDLLPYILPAGICCKMVKEINEVHEIETVLTTEDEVTVLRRNTILPGGGMLPGEPTEEIGQVLQVGSETIREQLRSDNTSFINPATQEVRATHGILNTTLVNPIIGLEGTDVYIHNRLYTVTWHYKDSNGQDVTDTTNEEYGAVPRHANPDDYGDYVFEGWSFTSDGEAEPSLTGVLDNTHYYAKYKVKN